MQYIAISDTSWNEICQVSLSHAWNKLAIGGPALPGSNPDRPGQDNPDIPDLGDKCAQLSLAEKERDEWLAADEGETGVQELIDEEIIDMVQEKPASDNEVSDDEECAAAVAVISHTQTVKCLNVSVPA